MTAGPGRQPTLPGADETANPPLLTPRRPGGPEVGVLRGEKVRNSGLLRSAVVTSSRTCDDGPSFSPGEKVRNSVAVLAGLCLLVGAGAARADLVFSQPQADAGEVHSGRP